MDEETREALELTKEQLVAMRDAGQPAEVAHTCAAYPRSTAGKLVALASPQPKINIILHSTNEGFRGVRVERPIATLPGDSGLVTHVRAD